MMRRLRWLPWYCPEDIAERDQRTREVVERSRSLTAKGVEVADRATERAKAIAESYRKADERLCHR